MTRTPEPDSTAHAAAGRRSPWHPSAAFAAVLGFPWRLFFAFLTTVVAGHCLFAELYDHAHEVLPVWARPTLAFAVLTYAALVLHAERLKSGITLSAMAVASMCLFFLGFDVHRFSGELLSPWLLVPASAAGFSGALYLAYRWRHELERGRTLRRVPAREYAQQSPLRALILTVSRPDAKPGDNVEILPAGGPHHVRFTSGEKTADVGGTDIGEALDDPKLNEVRPNWQQLLRALRRHYEEERQLDSVVLYGSKDSRLHDCASFLRPFLKGVEPKILPPVNLEDFEEVHGLLRGEVESLLQKKVRPEQIAVDITGGFKIPSVAGAVLTLNRAVVCQYVQSVGSDADQRKELDAQIYDFRWDKSLEMPA